MGIGDNIYYNRIRVGLSLEELADELNVSIQSVSDWELRISKPSMNQILLMCGLFSCSLDSLLIGETEYESVSENFIEDYECHMKVYARGISLAVGIFFFGIAVLLILLSLDSSIREVAIYVIPTIIASIFLFVKAALNHDEFAQKYPHLPSLYTKEKAKKAEIRLARLSSISIFITFFGVLMLVFRSELPVLNEMSTLFSVGIFLIVMGVSAMVMFNIAIRISIYDIKAYNRENGK